MLHRMRILGQTKKYHLGTTPQTLHPMNFCFSTLFPPIPIWCILPRFGWTPPWRRGKGTYIAVAQWICSSSWKKGCSLVTFFEKLMLMKLGGFYAGCLEGPYEPYHWHVEDKSWSNCQLIKAHLLILHLHRLGCNPISYRPFTWHHVSSLYIPYLGYHPSVRTMFIFLWLATSSSKTPVPLVFVLDSTSIPNAQKSSSWPPRPCVPVPRLRPWSQLPMSWVMLLRWPHCPPARAPCRCPPPEPPRASPGAVAGSHGWEIEVAVGATTTSWGWW